ncbi:MAG: manganese efflux pump [Candidatus Lokiarchaeota archaeon]|nr:manganese efflux pump [Candidatus Lokiarchaeota archaeon]
MDFVSLTLLSIGLSLDDFTLAFALSLNTPTQTSKDRLGYTSKMALAFSISTGVLPLIGWLIGLAIFEWVASFSAWVILIVFCGVGAWIIKEAFEDESSEWKKKDLTSFWVLLVMGTLGSIDEGAIGIGYPFLAIPIAWIIISVILMNTILVYLAMLVSTWKTRLNQKIPPILSGIIIIVLGIVDWAEIVF